MTNPYVIILGIFSVGGIFIFVWGLRNILQKQKTRQWKKCDGTVVSATTVSDVDPSPQFQIEYRVEQHRFEITYQPVSGADASNEVARQYLEKYPPGSHIALFYDPANPQRYTLNAGAAIEDWVILGLGLFAFILGTSFIVANL